MSTIRDVFIMRILLFILSCLLCCLLHSQPVQLNWVKQMGGNVASGNAIISDASGNVYTAGSFLNTIDLDPGVGTYSFTSTGSSAGDLYITKSDASGNLIWARQLGNANLERVFTIDLDPANNIYLTGSFDGTVDFDPGQGVFNLNNAGMNTPATFICKLDVQGNFVWAKKLGDYASHSDLVIDAAGNIYITGRFNTGDFDPGPGTYTLAAASMNDADIFISKLDAAGNFVWAKQMGGPLNDCGTGIVTDTSGNVYIIGYFSGTADFDPGTGTQILNSYGLSDVFISKLDPAGNFIWVKQLGGSSDELPKPILMDGSGNLVTVGVFSGTGDYDPGPSTFTLSPFGAFDIFVSKLDSSGNFIWAKQLGGATTDVIRNAHVDKFNNIYVTGCFMGTVDFDPGQGIVPLASYGQEDIFISKMDVAGNFAWAGQMGSPATDQAESIYVDNNGFIYVTGMFEMTADFDPESSTFTLNASGFQDAFICKLSQVCSATVAITTGTADLNICSGEHTTLGATGTGTVHWYSSPLPGIYLGSGNTYTTSNLSTGTYTYYAEAVGVCASPRSAVIVTVNACTGLEKSYSGAGYPLIYPNPGSGEFSIQINRVLENAAVKVYNALGELVFSSSLRTKESALDLKALSNGIYSVVILEGNIIVQQEKLIKH